MEASIYKMEKCGKKRKFVFSAKCQGLRKKTYLHVFCKIQIVENNMVFFLPQFCGKKRKFMFSAAAEKNITLKGIIFPRNRVVTGVGMDGLKAQPARSLPLPR